MTRELEARDPTAARASSTEAVDDVSSTSPSTNLDNDMKKTKPTRAMRKKWEKGIRAFHEEVRGGAIEYFFCSYSDLIEKMALASLLHNNVLAGKVLLGVADWINQMANIKPLCLNCDTEFTPSSLPKGFLIALPFANKSTALITGICGRCFALEDLDERAFQQMKKMWPEGYRITQRGSS